MKLKPFTTLICLLFAFNSFAQNIVKFNGKPYLVYPQTIDVGYSGMTMRIYNGNYEFANFNMPPVIGSIEDGEYLMYSTQYHLTNKRKFGSYYIYDTNYLVFATVTIKNNKKEGIAKFYSKIDQVKPYAEIPYQNDMINGSFVFYQLNNIYRNRYYSSYDFDYSESYYDGSNYSYGKNSLNIYSRIYKLNYKDGVPDGKQMVYSVSKNKKDTVLTNTGEYVKGARNGTFQNITYYYAKKKQKDLRVYKTETGKYINSKMEGEWLVSYEKGYKEYSYYEDDLLRAERDINTKGELIKYKAFSKDSVLKYIGSLDKEKTLPRSSNSYSDYYESSSDKKYEYKKSFYIKYGPGYYKSEYDYTFVYGNTVRSNYYRAETFQIDTLVQGRLVLLSNFRNYKGFSEQTAYLVDSCHKMTSSSSEYGSSSKQKTICKSEIWEKIINKKGVVKYNYTELYYRIFNADSLISQSKKIEKEKHSIEEKFYHAALDYTYWNKKFVKGNYNGYKRYFVVSGGFHDGRILKVIKIPTHYDTLTLTDTIMLKGKFLDPTDEDFDAAFGELTCFNTSSDDDLGDRAYFNNNFFNFFEPSANSHTSIYLGNKPFTGNLNLKLKYTKNPNKIKARVYDITYFFEFLVKRKVIDITVELHKSRLKTSSSRFMMPLSELSCNVEESVFSGEMNAYDIFNNMAYNYYVNANKINSEVNYKLFGMVSNKKGSKYHYNDDYYYDYFVNSTYRRYRYSRKPKKIKLDNIYEKPISSIQFEDGKKVGQWQLQNYNSISAQYSFRNNQKNGVQYKFDRYGYTFLKYLYNANKDTVDGKVWGLYRSGLPQYYGYFDHGVPNGNFIRYFMSDTVAMYRERFQFDHGFLVGQYQIFRDSGELKISIDLKKEDSMYYSIFKRVPRYEYNYVNGIKKYRPNPNNDRPIEKVDLSGSDFITSLFSSTFIKNGYYKYYYKSGTVFSEGFKKVNEPYGQWSFYREGKDRIYKKINFHDSVISIEGKDTVRSFGTVMAYYDDGKPMFKGLALDKETKYSCESESDIPTEEDYYLEFYDSLGNNILKEGSGFIEELQANGYKLKEGQIKNGKKEGIWIYYSKFGLPNGIGSFVNGKKEGRWLVGDLGGLNLTDKICFMSNEEFLVYINTYGGNLNLKEEFYTNGIKVSDNSVETIKR